MTSNEPSLPLRPPCRTPPSGPLHQLLDPAQARLPPDCTLGLDERPQRAAAHPWHAAHVLPVEPNQAGVGPSMVCVCVRMCVCHTWHDIVWCSVVQHGTAQCGIVG